MGSIAAYSDVSINDNLTFLKTCQQYPPLALMATLSDFANLFGPPTIASSPDHSFSPPLTSMSKKTCSP
jgi:hypothetical protein